VVIASGWSGRHGEATGVIAVHDAHGPRKTGETAVRAVGTHTPDHTQVATASRRTTAAGATIGTNARTRRPLTARTIEGMRTARLTSAEADRYTATVRP
jgi:hypothetical protein